MEPKDEAAISLQLVLIIIMFTPTKTVELPCLKSRTSVGSSLSDPREKNERWKQQKKNMSSDFIGFCRFNISSRRVTFNRFNVTCWSLKIL